MDAQTQWLFWAILSGVLVNVVVLVTILLVVFRKVVPIHQVTNEILYKLRGDLGLVHAKQDKYIEQQRNVIKTFIEADNSFKAMVDALRDISNLQQIRDQVDLVAKRLEDAHDKIRSQLGTSGEIINQLHALVSRWSTEGNELKEAYLRLANTIAETEANENAIQEQIRIDLERLLNEKSTNLSTNASK